MHHFDDYMSEYQVTWRRRQPISQAYGRQNGKRKPWILPWSNWEEGLWPDIRSGTCYALPDYLQRNKITKHQGVHNLKSSWVLSAKLYYPFRASEQGRELLAGFLKEHVCSRIESVDAVSFEYAEPSGTALHPVALLGEMHGSRGKGQTSPDIAFLANDRRVLLLTEVKFVEHSFYRCSARRTVDKPGKPGNPDPSRCMDVSSLPSDYERLCHQVTWGRRYWEHLAPIVSKEMFSDLVCCPAARAGFQLFRQHALAEGIANSGKYEKVISCLALDDRNETVQHCLGSTDLPDVHDWGTLFPGKAGFEVFTHQEWVAWVRAHARREWADWLGYVDSRYEFNR